MKDLLFSFKPFPSPLLLYIVHLHQLGHVRGLGHLLPVQVPKQLGGAFFTPEVVSEDFSLKYNKSHIKLYYGTSTVFKLFNAAQRSGEDTVIHATLISI
jgi:hypothetical protein